MSINICPKHSEPENKQNDPKNDLNDPKLSMSLKCNDISIVSGYWIVKGKHSHNSYKAWFKTSLKINCPYIFFCDNDSIKIIKQFRHDYNTMYIILPMNEFYTYKFINENGNETNVIKTDHRHCPSAEVWSVWNEKIFLIEKAKNLNPFNSKYFIWLDAGLSPYRNKTPPQTFPNIKKFTKTFDNKFVFTATQDNFSLNEYDGNKNGIKNENKCERNPYYHYISGTFLVHINIIDQIVHLYKQYLNDMNENIINTEQVILTQMYVDHKELFYELGKGYGTIVKYLA